MGCRWTRRTSLLSLDWVGGLGCGWVGGWVCGLPTWGVIEVVGDFCPVAVLDEVPWVDCEEGGLLPRACGERDELD